MDVNTMNGYAVRIIYDDPRTEEYRQKYQDALDEIARLKRIIEDLENENEKLNETIADLDMAAYELSEELSYYV